MDLCAASASELLEGLATKAFSAVELAQAHLERIERLNPSLNAFLRVDPPKVLEQAAAIDARRQRGEALGPLAGLPIAIKDVLCAVGETTTCGSKILAKYRPPYDATVIQKLRAADAVFLGRTNLDEFAMGSTCENSAFGPTRNPWDLTRTPGGSSGGSASATGARLTPLAIGTDTGGSIRQPAGFCGVVGLKPTYGRVSRYGLVAYASSLDQIGPFARSVADAGLLLQAIAGYDPKDSTSADIAVPDYQAALTQPIAGLRLGVEASHFGAGLDAEVAAAVRSAIKTFEQHGAKIVDVELPHAKYAVASYYLVATAEASSNLARYDGVHYGHRAQPFANLVDMYSTSRAEGFGPEVKRRIMLGTFALSAGYRDAYYIKALKIRRLIQQDYLRAFEKADMILGPVAPAPPPRLGEVVNDPLAMYLGDIYTLSANLAGLPALALPAGFTPAGLPIGMQLQGPVFSEADLLRAGAHYQAWTDWSRQSPKL